MMKKIIEGICSWRFILGAYFGAVFVAVVHLYRYEKGCEKSLAETFEKIEEMYHQNPHMCLTEEERRRVNIERDICKRENPCRFWEKELKQ